MLTENQHNIFKATEKNIFKNFFFGINIRSLRKHNDELEVQVNGYRSDKPKKFS